MKKLIIRALAVIILLLALNSCKAAEEAADACLDSSTDCSVEIVVNDPITEDDPEIIIDATTDIDPEEGEIIIEIVVNFPGPDPISLTLLTADTLYFYDGQFVEQLNANPIDCGYRCFTSGDQRIIYGDSGEIVSFDALIVEPSMVLGDWIIKDIPPLEAQAGGALFKDYSQIYFQGAAVGHWSSNQWKTTDLIQTISGDVLALEGGIFHPLTAVTGINHAKDLLIRDYDAVNRTAVIETLGIFPVSWLTNYFNQAKDWLELDGVWYSSNGYEFETDLSENVNALWSWNTAPYIVDLPAGQQPVVLWAGTFDGALYGIEANTGTLFRYLPESDTLETVLSLYFGDGYRTTGLAYKDSLSPIIVENSLYFYDDSIWALDLESGIVNLFFGGSGRVEGW